MSKSNLRVRVKVGVILLVNNYLNLNILTLYAIQKNLVYLHLF